MPDSAPAGATTDLPATDPPATDPPATDPPATGPPAADPPAAALSAPAGAGAAIGDGAIGEGELALPYWLTSTEEAANTSFSTTLRRLPRLLRDAWLLAWRASRGTTAAVVGFQVAGGVASAVGMISVVGIFDGLLRDGPTPERVRAAVPSLVLLVVAAAVRGLLTSAAAAANGRLSPLVFQAAEMQLLELTTRVELSTFDDPGWRDAMERARDRGISAAEQLVDRAIELVTNVIGLAAAASVLAVLHPVLLPLLVVAVLPIGWASVRSARLNYRRLLRLIAVWRRRRMLSELLAARESAPELRRSPSASSSSPRWGGWSRSPRARRSGSRPSRCGPRWWARR
jgi:ATP-binding cassette, subfamily B, bacterial